MQDAKRGEKSPVRPEHSRHGTSETSPPTPASSPARPSILCPLQATRLVSVCHCPVMSCQESVRATSHRKCVPSGRSQPASAGVARATLLPGVELPWDFVVLGVPISVQARRCSSVQRWKSLVQSSAGGLPRRRRWIDTALGEMPGDDHSLDLVGALEDLHDSGPSGSLPGQQPAWPRGISRDSARVVRRLVVAASGGRAAVDMLLSDKGVLLAAGNAKNHYHDASLRLCSARRGRSSSSSPLPSGSRAGRARPSPMPSVRAPSWRRSEVSAE